MISICAPTFDINGSVVLLRTEKSDMGSMSRRSSVTPTIDGGSVPQYRGYSVTDRKFSIVAEDVPQADIDRLETMVDNSNELIVSTAIGCFLCAVLFIKPVAETVTIPLHVVGQEA